MGTGVSPDGEAQPTSENIKILTTAEFWADKQAQVSEQQVGIESGLTATQAEVFKNLRDRHAHQLQYLPFDRVLQ